LKFLHHTLTITVKDKKHCEFLRDKCFEIAKSRMQVKDPGSLFSDIKESLINDFHTIIMTPDGSKLGYDTALEAESVRNTIVEFLNEWSQANLDVPMNYVLISYGKTEATIIASN